MNRSGRHRGSHSIAVIRDRCLGHLFYYRRIPRTIYSGNKRRRVQPPLYRCQCSDSRAITRRHSLPRNVTVVKNGGRPQRSLPRFSACTKFLPTNNDDQRITCPAVSTQQDNIREADGGVTPDQTTRNRHGVRTRGLGDQCNVPSWLWRNTL